MNFGWLLEQAFKEFENHGAISKDTLLRLRASSDELERPLRSTHEIDHKNPHKTELFDLHDATVDLVPADNEVLAYDSTTSEWINQTPAEAGLSIAPVGTVNGVNLIKNYPSVELADATAPQWWSATSCTITEEDATGESLSGVAPNERILKGVTSATNAYIYQTFTITDERLLQVGTNVSYGAWVYVVTAGTVDMFIWDSTNSQAVGTPAETTTTGGWVWLEVTDGTIASGATTLYIRFRHSATTATFYVANPTLNVGTEVIAWKQRLLAYRYTDETGIVTNADPTVTTYTTGDATATTSANTVAVQFKTYYLNATTSPLRYLYMRPYFATNDQIVCESLTTSTSGREIFTLMVDDQQRFSWKVNGGSGETEHVYINVLGYWEWE